MANGVSLPYPYGLAFQQALKELEAEGGIETRYSRYLANNHVLRQK